MRKSLLFFVVSVLLFVEAAAQDVTRENVARECVLLEIFTGVRCSNCPAVALGVARMLEEGKNIAPVAYHTNAWSIPELYTNETNARATYYGVQGYPTVRVDGSTYFTGGGPASYEDAIYGSYLMPKYNQRVNVPSPYTIELYVDYTSGTQCEVTAVVNKVGDAADNLRLFMVMTESKIQRSWQGLKELNFVVRDMLPNQNGSVMTAEDTQSFTETFDIGGYDRMNCEIVAWVQNYSTKEVLQAVRFPLSEMQIDNDARILDCHDMVTTTCSGKVSPCVTFVNNGSSDMTSASFVFKDENANEIYTHLWEGNLAGGEEAEIIVPDLYVASSKELVIELSEVNGAADGFPVDNVYTAEFTEPYDIEGYVKLQLVTSSDPEDMTIRLINMDTEEVVNTYVYDTPRKMVKEEIFVPEIGCYRMEFVSSMGKGLEDGFFELQDADGVVVYSCDSHNEFFKHSLNIEMYSSSTVNVEEVKCDDISIYPNPVSSVLNISVDNLKNVRVYNAVGQMIFEDDADCDMMKIDTESWQNGVYYVNIETSDGGKSSQKIIVSK